MTDPVAASPLRRRWPRRVLLQIAALAVGVVLLESGARLVQRLRGRAWDSEGTRSEILRVRSQSREFAPRAATDWFQNPADDPAMALHLHPFLAWEAGTGEGLLDAERELGRSPEHAGVYDILILGGSAAAIFGIEEQGAGPLKEILSADPRFQGRELHFLQFGSGGYKQPQQVDRLVYLLSMGISPDAVIDIDGFNELALGNKNATMGASPVFPSVVHWAFLAASAASDRRALDLALDLRQQQRAVDGVCDLALSWRFDRSCVLGTLALGRIHALRNDCVARQEACARYMTELSAAIVRGPAFQGGVEEAVEASVRAWFEGSRMLQDICRARSIHYLHVLQPTLHDEGSKPLTDGEIRNGTMEEAWIQGIRRGYPRLREAGARLRALGVNFLDCSLVFAGVTDGIYFDACHFGKQGNRILAEKIGAAFLESMPAPR